jgi:6-phosphogluconolactonase
MKRLFGSLVVATLATAGCGGGSGSSNPAPCFTPQPGVYYLSRNAIFVANAGSSSISAFQEAAPSAPLGAACGSPFAMTGPPTALGGGGSVPSSEIFDLIVLSLQGKTISLFAVNFITSILTGPVATLTTTNTPVAVAVWRNYFYVAHTEGTVSAYEVSGSAQAPSLTRVPGSPFPAGSGPVAIAAADPGLLFVANSQSDNISGYSLDSGGVPTPLPGSPFPAGTSPSSIEVAPPAFPNPSGGPTLVIVTNEGSNNVSVYSVRSNGTLGAVPGSPFAAGAGPASSATGNYLPLKYLYVANSQSNNLSGYSIDDASGVLTPLTGSPFAAGEAPSSVAVSAGGLSVYVLDTGSDDLSVFSLDQSTGALAPASGSPFAVGRSPSSLVLFQVPES